MFGCKHNWDLLDKTLIKSPYTLTLEAGKMQEGQEWTGESVMVDKLVYVFMCDLCGKVKTTEH